jgi:hypothetical protein
MIRSIEQINESLAGFSDVVSLEIAATRARSADALRITLANSSGETVVLFCEDVSGLHLAEFGGGSNQFLVLRGRNVRDEQLDRVTFHFCDVERDAIAFDCVSADVAAL